MNDLVFSCPQCGQQVTCAPEGAGQQVPCPTCQTVITVPASSQPPPPPSPPGGPRAQAPVGPPKKSNGLAVASLVLSLLAPLGSIPAIICGHMAKARIKRDPAVGGKGLATAGLVLGYGFLSLSLIGVLLAFTVFASLFNQAKNDLDKRAANTNKTMVVTTDTAGQTPPKSTKPAKSGKKTTTPKPAKPEPEPAKADDAVAAVEIVINDYLAAEKKRDADTMKSLFTKQAQANFKPATQGVNVAGVSTRITKTEVEGENARSIVKVTLGPVDASAMYRLKIEEGNWRIYAITILMDNDEPGITVDFEKGLTPVTEADPQKVAAYFTRLNQLAGKSATTSKKAKSGGATRPPTVQPVEPSPPKPEPPPEPVVALNFGGHNRPADVELVEFSGAARVVKARVVNYANKPIRKLNVTIFFLDAAASPLGQKFGSLLNPDPHIVPKGGAAEVVFPGVTAPAEAQKAVIELREVQFKDGSSWKPPQ